MKLTILFSVLVLAACGKDDKKAGGAANVTGGCFNETAGDCYEYPAGGNATTLADICDNDPAAKWVASCPREGLVGGCKSGNKYDKGAPTHFFYKGTVDEVKTSCGGDTFVEK